MTLLLPDPPPLRTKDHILHNLDLVLDQAKALIAALYCESGTQAAAEGRLVGTAADHVQAPSGDCYVISG
jgi:hypothetical protein